MEYFTRDEFVAYFVKRNISPGILLIPESFPVGEAESVYCKHFIRTTSPTVFKRTDDKTDKFWDWCITNLIGDTRIFSCNEGKEEWWGFTEHDDIALFVLRWL